MKKRKRSINFETALEPWMRNSRLFQALFQIHGEIVDIQTEQRATSSDSVDWDRAVVHWTTRHGRRLGE